MYSRFKTRKKIRNNNIKINKSVLLKLLLLIVLFAIFISLFSKILCNIFLKSSFENSLSDFANLNQKIYFKLSDITLYSSATAKKNEEVKYSLNLNIYQYTDISFKIENIENIQIDEFYIDNISFTNENSPFLLYKNPLEFGKFTNFEPETLEKINFNVLNSSENIDYSSPYVFGNLANPITLEYINKDVKKNYSINGDIALTYDGSLLQKCNVSLLNLNCTVSFDINIVANSNTYTCKLSLPITFKDETSTIYNGEFMQNLQASYNFYRLK